MTLISSGPLVDLDILSTKGVLEQFLYSSIFLKPLAREM